MAIQSYTMGPGTLSMGIDPDDLDVSCQVRTFRVEASEKVKSVDPQPMLCGEDKVTADKVTLDWKATGTIQQDLAAAGVVAYSWDNATIVVEFAFVPSTAAGRKVTGTMRLVPISIGGDAGSDPDSPITWVLPSTPVLADV